MGSKAIKIIVVLFVIVFFVHQIYSSLFKPIVTQSADYYEHTEGMEISAYIIRNEKTVSANSDNVLHFVVGDGSRVAKNGTIAQIYNNKNASVTVTKIENLKSQIADIEDLQAYNDQKAADLELITNRVSSSVNDLIYSAAHGNYNNMSEPLKNYLLSINRQQMITGEQTDFNEQIESLKAELSSLSQDLPTPIDNITAHESGYFISSIDGYENVLSADNLDAVTPEFLKKLSSEKKDSNVIGKIVSDYEWYIAAKVTLNDSLKYKIGDKLTIKTMLKSTPELSVTVKQINMSEDNKSAVVIYACQQMNSEIASMRTGTMTVVNSVHKGLKIPRKALRVSNSQTGVYVLSGITLEFVAVNVIFSNDNYDFIICEQQTSNDDVLRLYDEVVVKGRNLYDGKIVG